MHLIRNLSLCLAGYSNSGSGRVGVLVFELSNLAPYRVATYRTKLIDMSHICASSIQVVWNNYGNYLPLNE